MNDTFFSKLEKSIEKKNSLLCVGLDPQMDIAFEDDVIDTIYQSNKTIIDQTIEYAACFKPNIAFYEQFGPEGLVAFKKTLELIPEDTPVIIDAKRSDIGNTAQAYAKSLFGNYNADAVTLNPYLGRDSIQPFLDYSGKGIFMLCRTSNPGSDIFQTLPLLISSGRAAQQLYLKIAAEVCSWSPDIGLVVAANDPRSLKAVRALLPDVWLLGPGIGAQGGSIAEAMAAGAGKDGSKILLNASREIANAPLPGKRAREIRDLINQARQKTQLVNPLADEDSDKKALIREIIEIGCFQVGSFKVKSGQISPFYIDLRKIISKPTLLARVAAAYAVLIRDLDYDLIAGIPFAGVPIATALSLQLDKPQVFPRLQQKAHGTGNTIEGIYQNGQRALLVDDLITTGKSKLEACEILRQGGLKVTELVVLIERGRQGRQDLEQAGIRLHACFTVEDFFVVCQEMGMIDNGKLAELRQFVNQ